VLGGVGEEVGRCDHVLHQLPDVPVAARRRISQLPGLDAAHDPIGDVACVLKHAVIERCRQRLPSLLALSPSRQLIFSARAPVVKEQSFTALVPALP
jgi:hypothetical protein